MTNFVEKSTYYNAIHNILFGIFSSSIVSFIISISSYFHKRDIFINKIDKNIYDLYINMYVTSKFVGKILTQSPYEVPYVSSKGFKYIYDLCELNINFINNMDLNLFIPFVKFEKFYRIYANIVEYTYILSNIKNISMSIDIIMLEYANLYLKIEKDKLSNGNCNNVDLQNLDLLKNLMTVKIAKFHEYITDQFIEIEKITKLFYEYRMKKASWKDKQQYLIALADAILADRN